MPILDIANYFLYLNDRGSKRSITHLKLQKLVFYIQAVSCVLLRRPLFEEDFEAWVHGPVSPDLYYEFKQYGSDVLPNITEEPELDEDTKRVIRTVWKMYGDKTGKFLENKTHKEEPWQQARDGLGYFESSNNIIEKQDIQEYYTRKFSI